MIPNKKNVFAQPINSETKQSLMEIPHVLLVQLIQHKILLLQTNVNVILTFSLLGHPLIMNVLENVKMLIPKTTPQINANVKQVILELNVRQNVNGKTVQPLLQQTLLQE